MPDFAAHLKKLTSSIDLTQGLDEFTDSVVDVWLMHSTDITTVTELLPPSSGAEVSWTSLLDLEWKSEPSLGEFGSANLVDQLYHKLRSNPDISLLLPSLASLLSSHKTDEEITEELTNMFGFDAVELVMEIINSRLPLSYKLAIVDNDTHVLSEKTTRRRKDKFRAHYADGVNFTADDAKRRMEFSLRENMSRPLFLFSAPHAPEVLPHVYTSSPVASGNLMSNYGSKYSLPIDTRREITDDYEEVTVPPPKPVPPRDSERLIPVSELDGFIKGSFPGYTSLNRIQSIVYPTAYGTNENMLICAPTGAGKTDVAMLTVLHVISQNLSLPDASSEPSRLAYYIRRNEFKIVYVAPMKALAAEIVRKFGKRLAWLSIQVRELTGDMQLTKSEIAETQIIVTTPEKWDVVTRKPIGEGGLQSKVKLLIIDEVHLLNEERGAVIETIVARTLRQVESTQSLIRVVGLSATLPNYIDVADFLRVSRHRGLFYFDSSFRPIPLEQHFLGIKGKINSLQARQNLDRVTFDKVLKLVLQGHQVLVFVHSRKETVKSVQALREAALAAGTLDEFSCQEHPSFFLFRKEIGTSRNKEMKELFNDGFGIHHAGMLRSDRNMMERMFEARAIKVLCCTSTLAWGVNLPAHAVIIKGTHVYDNSRGSVVDLSVLDVLQIFGRAGRPGFETSGEGYICTPEEKLQHYLDAVVAQHPIESKFKLGMVDALNAEISLGTVANIEDAIQWIGYTYLFVRMRRNPLFYGMTHEEPQEDPQLRKKRHELVTAAARELADAQMITFNEYTSSLVITDLGRIAARYYIKATSIEIFNKVFRPDMAEADVLGMLSMSTEFGQIQLRENEIEELKRLEEVIPCQVKDGTDTSQGKVNILLQGYISRVYIGDFALVSDTAYVAQNGARIVRGLLEIAITRKWASVCAVLISMSKAVEKRMWPFEHPLAQSDLSQEVLHNLQRWADEVSVADLAIMDAVGLGQLVHLNERHGAAIVKAAKHFPTVKMTHFLQPLSPDLLRISIRVSRTFEWNLRLHGSTEPFWLWVEDQKGVEIIQWSHLSFRSNTEHVEANFVIPIRGSKPFASVNIRFVSDRWLGADDIVNIQLGDIIMPILRHCHTPLLDLPFLPVTVVKEAKLRQFYSMRLQTFNGIQTQCFWTLAHTNQNVLICSPAGSGTSTLVMLALWQKVDSIQSGSHGLVIVPSRSAAREFESLFHISADRTRTPLTTILSPEALLSGSGRGISITTPHCLMEALDRPGSKEWLSRLKIVLCENLELLDARYELAVSLLIHKTQTLPVRFVGVTSCLNDPTDLARWLSVPLEAVHSFRACDREQALSLKVLTFTTPYSAALLKEIAKPTYAAIRDAGPQGTSLVFVPSRSQCPGVAADLIMQSAIDIDTRGFLGRDVSAEDLQPVLMGLQNGALSDLITHGIGVFHEGVHRADVALVLRLYLEGIIRVLIVPREACWTVPVRAGVVIVMGAQYTQAGPNSDKQVREYSLQELTRMQTCAIQPRQPGVFHLFCKAEQCETFSHFLTDGLPLESDLMTSDLTRRWLTEMRKAHSVVDKQQALDALSFTYLAQRLRTNPMYYGASRAVDEGLSRWVDSIWGSS